MAERRGGSPEIVVKWEGDMKGGRGVGRKRGAKGEGKGSKEEEERCGAEREGGVDNKMTRGRGRY